MGFEGVFFELYFSIWGLHLTYVIMAPLHVATLTVQRELYKSVVLFSDFVVHACGFNSHPKPSS